MSKTIEAAVVRVRSAQAATARALAAMVPGDADWDATHHAYISAVMNEREALTAYFGASEEARKWVKVDALMAGKA